ncbi:MAG: hypothetical protein ACKVS8_10595 [Phycisphaerales bacterium]
MNEPTQPKGERAPVLELGLEGGGASITRTPCAPGGWQFYVSGNSFDLDENDDEVWRNWTKGPVNTLPEALSVIARDGVWVLFHPISVQAEYREAVWQQVQEHVKVLPAERMRRWLSLKGDWEKVCARSP